MWNTSRVSTCACTGRAEHICILTPYVFFSKLPWRLDQSSGTVDAQAWSFRPTFGNYEWYHTSRSTSVAPPATDKVHLFVYPLGAHGAQWPLALRAHARGVATAPGAVRENASHTLGVMTSRPHHIRGPENRVAASRADADQRRPCHWPL